MNDSDERMMRLNGKRPTARDKWQAFYRLWRIANKVDESHGLRGTALDALRMLGYAGLVAMANDRGQIVGGRGHWPAFLRRRFVEMDRRRREEDRKQKMAEKLVKAIFGE